MANNVVSLEEYAKKVREMRDQQNRYFKAGSRGNNMDRMTALEASKRLEYEVDIMTKAILNPPTAKQENLF